jgi:hypothetical protein
MDFGKTEFEVVDWRVWIRIETVLGCCERSNESACFIKGRELFG